MKNLIMHITLLLLLLMFRVDFVSAKGTAGIEVTNEQLKTSDPCQVLKILEKYENDPCRWVREQAYRYEVRLANLQPKPEIRREVTARLVKACFDPNLGMHNHALKWLLSFKEEDFTDATKAAILQVLTKRGAWEQYMASLICGVANVHEALPHLKGLLIDELEFKSHEKEYYRKWYHTLGWQARLARARMGVKEDIDKCIELAEAEDDLDARVTVLMHDIGYIRQPEAIKYIQKYLESNERILPTNPGALGEPVASYVIDILAECLRDFPVKSGGRRYKPEEIELCRKWMTEQKEWKIIR
jgi:hypothetical protein